ALPAHRPALYSHYERSAPAPAASPTSSRLSPTPAAQTQSRADLHHRPDRSGTVAQLLILRANGQFQVSQSSAALIARWRVPSMRRTITIAISALLLVSFRSEQSLAFMGCGKWTARRKADCLSRLTQTTSPPPAASPPLPL